MNKEEYFKLLVQVMEYLDNCSKSELKSFSMSVAMMLPPEEIKKIMSIEQFLSEYPLDKDVHDIMMSSKSEEEMFQKLMDLVGDAVFKYDNR
tara:strand:- start:139 stop:414 length:276 start_codon:yes stop_codon:yes gene_type:complete